MATMEEIREQLVKIYAGDFRGLGNIREARSWLFEQKRKLENEVRTARTTFARTKAEVQLSALLFEMRMSGLVGSDGRVTAVGRPYVKPVRRYETASGGPIKVRRR